MENNEKKPLGLAQKLKSNKFKHGSLATIFTVVFIALIIVLNVVVSALSERFPSMNVDLTAEKLNTLSESSVTVAKDVQQPTEIYLIGTENAIMNDEVYSQYQIKYSQVANLAKKMQESNGKITMRFIDPDREPKFISDYAEDDLRTGDVLVKTEARHRVLRVTDLFSLQQNQQTGETKNFSKVDGALANAVYLTNLETVPLVAVATGHNEMLDSQNRAALDQVLKENAFDVQEFNILTEEIPEKAQMILLATPSTDYTKEEIEKLRTFVAGSTAENTRALFVACNPTQGVLPNLASFLEEWGVSIKPGVVIESDSTKALTNNPSYFFANSTDKIFPDNSYENLLATYSSPLSLNFGSNNDISTYTLLESSDTAYVAEGEELEENPDTAVHTLATLSQRISTQDKDTVKSNVIVMGNTVSLLSGFVDNSAFGNKQYMTDLFQYATGTSDAGQGITVAETETSMLDMTASAAVVHTVGLIVFTIALPLCILILGLVVFLRRRHL